MKHLVETFTGFDGSHNVEGIIRLKETIGHFDERVTFEFGGPIVATIHGESLISLTVNIPIDMDDYNGTKEALLNTNEQLYNLGLVVVKTKIEER